MFFMDAEVMVFNPDDGRDVLWTSLHCTIVQKLFSDIPDNVLSGDHYNIIHLSHELLNMLYDAEWGYWLTCRNARFQIPENQYDWDSPPILTSPHQFFNEEANECERELHSKWKDTE